MLLRCPTGVQSGHRREGRTQGARPRHMATQEQTGNTLFGIDLC